VTGRELYELAHKAGLAPIHITRPPDWESQEQFIQDDWDDLATKVMPINHDTCPVLQRAEAVWKRELSSAERDVARMRMGVYDRHDQDERTLLGAFLAGEGTITAEQLERWIKAFGYDPMTGYPCEEQHGLGPDEEMMVVTKQPRIVRP
jgi:hypothetical protein